MHISESSEQRSRLREAHSATGLYALLQGPSLYVGLQKLLARQETRRIIAEKYIRAQPGDRVVDIGCGPGAMLPYLGPVRYMGFDLNYAYIKRAEKVYQGRGVFFQSRVEDAADRLETGIDIVIAIAILHHLDDAEARTLIATAHRILKSGGRLITFDPVLTFPQNPIARSLIRLDRGKCVRTENGYRRLAEDAFGCVTVDVRKDLLRLPYTHCIVESTK